MDFESSQYRTEKEMGNMIEMCLIESKPVASDIF